MSFKINPSSVSPIVNHQRHGRSWRACSAVLIMAALGSSFAGCDDDFDGRYDGRSGFGRGEDRWDRDGRDGRGGWRRWHRGHHRGAPDAATDAGPSAPATDAGDAGLATNADAAAQPVGGDLLDAGAGTPDAAAATGAAALSDGQILLVADTLLAGGIGQAQAALPGLAEPGAEAFAEQLIDEHAAARNTLAAIGESIGAGEATSNIADALSAENDALAAALAAPDAGSIDALYLESLITAHGAALVLVGELRTGADAAALQAQLLVIQALLELQLGRAETIAAAL